MESLELTAPVAAFDGAIYIRPDSPTVVRDLHAVLGTALKIVAVSADPSLTARCEQELQRRLESEAWAARSNASYVDITHAYANKGMVVRDVSRIFNLPLDEIATIGDMPNDIPMLALAGVGIAMGNASEEVRSVARHVTTSNDDEGFANAVEHFILADRQRATGRCRRHSARAAALRRPQQLNALCCP